jgi:hypothetical protein
MNLGFQEKDIRKVIKENPGLTVVEMLDII